MKEFVQRAKKMQAGLALREQGRSTLRKKYEKVSPSDLQAYENGLKALIQKHVLANTNLLLAPASPDKPEKLNTFYWECGILYCHLILFTSFRLAGEEKGWSNAETYKFFLDMLFEFFEIIEIDCRTRAEKNQFGNSIVTLTAWTAVRFPALRCKIDEILAEVAIKEYEMPPNAVDLTGLTGFYSALTKLPSQVNYRMREDSKTIAQQWQKRDRDAGLPPSHTIDPTYVPELPIDVLNARVAMEQAIQNIDGENERQILHVLHQNPNLLDYGGNQALAELLNRSASQIGVEKSRAFKKMRMNLERQLKNS